MNVFNKYFNRTRVKCPRCLGKGNVDENDLVRLNRELKWGPGMCAYCIGEGTVTSKMASSLPADTTYLTLDLPEDERNRLFNNDRDAMLRAIDCDNQINNFINQVEYLHLVGKLSPESITDFFLIGSKTAMKNAKERLEILDYVNNIITFRKS